MAVAESILALNPSILSYAICFLLLATSVLSACWTRVREDGVEKEFPGVFSVRKLKVRLVGIHGPFAM